MAASCELIVRNKIGLHARPAATFVKTAAGFLSNITVENLTKRTPSANAKSILSVLLSAVQMGDRIRISAEGSDEQAAIDALSHLIESNFGEVE